MYMVLATAWPDGPDQAVSPRLLGASSSGLLAPLPA